MRLTFAILILLSFLALTADAKAQNAPSWESLATQAKAASDKADAANQRIDQIIRCAQQGKIYAGSNGNAGPAQCNEASSNANVNLTAIMNTLASLNNNLSSLGNNYISNLSTMNNVLACNRSGQIFNGHTCVPATGTSVCTLKPQPAAGTSCPPESLQTGTSGATPVCVRVVCN